MKYSNMFYRMRIINRQDVGYLGWFSIYADNVKFS